MPTSAETDTEQADGALRRVWSNFFQLLKGRGASALLVLAATALVARALEPAAFGLVVLIHTYLLTLRGLVNLKPFEAIIRYGVKAQEDGQPDRLRQLLRMTTVLDITLALAGCLLGVSLVGILGPVLGWDDQARQLAMLYSLLLLSSATGTASGVLRLYNRFDLLGLRQALGPLLLLLIVVLVWLQEGGYEAFLWAYGVAWLAENLLLLQFARREMRRHPHLQTSFWKGPVWRHHRQRFPGFWSFLQVVYWQGNLDMVPKQLSVMAVGALLGPAAAGMYRLARQISKLLTVPALLLRQVLFPDLARYWHRGDPRFTRVVKLTVAVSLAFGVGVAVLAGFVAEPAINLLAGEGYAGATAVVVWLMLSAGLDLGVSGLRAAGYAMGLAGQLLRLYLISILVYVVLFALLSQSAGLAGTGMAAALWSLLSLLLVGLVVWRRMLLADSQGLPAPVDRD